MEEMKFEELTELKEPERLLESAMPFSEADHAVSVCTAGS